MSKVALQLLILLWLFLIPLYEVQCSTKFRVPFKKCNIPSSAPQKIEKIINECQDEFKLVILSETFDALAIQRPQSRVKREVFTDDDRQIAGCLLQCVYRKMNAVNSYGFPTVKGLVDLYSEGINETVTTQVVTKCLTKIQKKYFKSQYILEGGTKACDIAYDVFECVSSQIEDYCGQKP